jgi:parvulin-like peptidyl-prolyl isomerase
MVKRWLGALFAVAFLIFSSSAVSGEEAEQKGEAGKVLVEMKDGSITKEELQQRMNRIGEQTGMKADLSKDREAFLEDMIHTKLFALEARREKMDERSDISAEIKDAVENILASNYLREHVREKIRVTDDEIKAYMEKKPELLKTPETVVVRRILIGVQKDATQETVEAARKQAEEVLAKVKAGEDFAKLSEAYSGEKEGKKEKKGKKEKEGKKIEKRSRDIVYIKKGKMGKEIDDIVFGLNIGEVSPVLRTREGFTIVKVEDKKPARNLTMKEVRLYVTSVLMAEKERDLTEALLKELTEKYGVRIHKELL